MMLVDTSMKHFFFFFQIWLFYKKISVVQRHSAKIIYFKLFPQSHLYAPDYSRLYYNLFVIYLYYCYTDVWQILLKNIYHWFSLTFNRYFNYNLKLKFIFLTLKLYRVGSKISLRYSKTCVLHARIVQMKMKIFLNDFKIRM